MMVPDGVAVYKQSVDAAMAVEPVLSRLEGAGQQGASEWCWPDFRSLSTIVET